MPNWVINKVKFNCDHDKFMEIVKDISCEDCFGLIDFNKVIPMPESEEANWYHWCIENWGTKWNARLNTSLNFDDDDTVILFVTAWSTPEPIILLFRSITPTLILSASLPMKTLGITADVTVLKTVMILSKCFTRVVEREKTLNSQTNFGTQQSIIFERRNKND